MALLLLYMSQAKVHVYLTTVIIQERQKILKKAESPHNSAVHPPGKACPSPGTSLSMDPKTGVSWTWNTWTVPSREQVKVHGSLCDCLAGFHEDCPRLTTTGALCPPEGFSRFK